MSLILEGVEKRYASHTALDGISLTLRPGEISGLLGPNGAGKSTLLKILAAYFYPTAGRVSWRGIDPREDPAAYRRLVGYLPEGSPLPGRSTARDLLTRAWRDYRRTEPGPGEIESLLDRYGIGEGERDKPVKTLSRGYNQRTGLALAEAGDPSLLLLDEPFSGLDPSRVRSLRETLRAGRENRAILFSSHILQEVYALCDRILIMGKGRILGDVKRADFSGWEGLDDYYSSLTGRGDE